MPSCKVPVQVFQCGLKSNCINKFP